MKKEYDFSKARLNKRPIVKKQNLKKSQKLQKTIRLDEDVFEWLLKESKEQGLPYQTFLNATLKRTMNREDSLLKRLEKIEAVLKIKKSS